jgi:hypothetical protein
MMTENKAPAPAAALKSTPLPPSEALSLRQKIIQMRKTLPTIKKERHSDGVKYAFSKIDDIWGPIRPVMDELGVLFEFVHEQPTRVDENGHPSYWTTVQAKTFKGDKLMWIYESDMTYRWVNVDSEDEVIEVVLHALGWNDDPAKAKGAARTYAVKYYLWDEFSVDQGEDDPDARDMSAQGRGGQRPPAGNRGQNPARAPAGGKLTDAQIRRLFGIATKAGYTRETITKRIQTRYNRQSAADLTRQEYDEICAAIERHSAAAQGATQAQEPPQGGEQHA